MLEWLLRSAGVGDVFLQHLDHVRFSFQNWWILGAGFALLVPIAVWIHRRQARNLGSARTRTRHALTGLRVATLAAMVAILAGPIARLDMTTENKPMVAVILDRSQSMALAAGPYETAEEAARIAMATGLAASPDQMNDAARRKLDETPRAQLAETALALWAEQRWKPLLEKYDLRVYSSARELTAMERGDDPKTWPKATDAAKLADGSASHLGDAVVQALDRKNVAGVVLLTDGRSNGGVSLGSAATAAAEAGAPIFPVPVGSMAKPRDAAIADAYAPSEAAVNDFVRVAVVVESQRLDGKTVTVQLKEGSETLDSRILTLSSVEQQQLELRFQAKTPGIHRLAIEILAPEGEPEALQANNHDSVFVQVSDDKIKVLQIDGWPRWDARFLKNAVRRDNGLGGKEGDEPEIILESEVSRRSPADAANALPRDPDALAQYHVIVLGDATPKLIDEPFLNALSRAVREKGLGLIVAAGPRAMPHAYGQTLRGLLPVVLPAGRAGLDAPAYQPHRWELTPEGSLHEAMQLHDDLGRNRATWEEFPAYYWCAAVERQGLAATVLLRNPSVSTPYGKTPIIAHHFAGKGKVLFLGTDSTWLWRRHVGDRYFDRFWGQAIRFAAREDPTSAKQSKIRLRPLKVQPGDQVTAELVARDPQGEPVKASEATLTLTWDAPDSLNAPEGPRSQTLIAVADPSAPGLFRAAFRPESVGGYRIAYEPGDAADPAKATFEVVPPIEELRDSSIDRGGLSQLAASTGGRLLELDQLAELPALLKGESSVNELHRETTVWDNWLVLAILATIYCLDVAIRRLSGLS